ncbi:Transcriptional regulatory protein DegU [Xylophilus ampelinus]|nr:Transcriptional regulatory protein DegU [Xylophilus ampelinus]
MKILLVDDHALFRAGLRLLLATIQPGAQVLEADSAASAIDIARQHPDLPLCLLDLALGEGHGLDALAAVKQAAPEVAVVVVSASTDGAVIRDCLDAGAMSFIPKSLSAQHLMHAVQQVLTGRTYLPEELLKTVAAPPAPQLTPRQLDVLGGLCRGLPSKSIARELQLSEYTVKEYVSALFQTLGVRNRTEAAIAATRLGLAAGIRRTRAE